MDNGVNAILVVDTPPEFNLWDMNKTHSNEELKETLTRILNDKDWLTYPTENDFEEMVLEKLKIYSKSLLSFNDDDLLLAKAILILFESLYTGLMSKEIDNWSLLMIDTLDQSTVRVIVYL